jgi:predicted nucleic acid-binding protein
VTSCVVDASVAAKWLLPAAGEGLIGQANDLAARHVKRELFLLAPDLMAAEIGNVLWKAVRRQRISRIEAENSLQRFTDLAIRFVPVAGLLAPTFQIAVTCDRSFYESLYVALALITKTEFITADERLVNALGSRFPVRWLGSL